MPFRHPSGAAPQKEARNAPRSFDVKGRMRVHGSLQPAARSSLLSSRAVSSLRSNFPRFRGFLASSSSLLLLSYASAHEDEIDDEVSGSSAGEALNLSSIGNPEKTSMITRCINTILDRSLQYGTPFKHAARRSSAALPHAITTAAARRRGVVRLAHERARREHGWIQDIQPGAELRSRGEPAFGLMSYTIALVAVWSWPSINGSRANDVPFNGPKAPDQSPPAPGVTCVTPRLSRRYRPLGSGYQPQCDQSAGSRCHTTPP
jgi:hypothetical protein